jgi:asparagine synthase (glutamine-hydrolysing)
VQRLDGMFAFGLWDRKERTLTLVRDRNGKKPLFYVNVDGALYFASETQALFAAGVPQTFDVAALPSLLAFGSVHPPRTIYEHVHQVPPATISVVRDNLAVRSEVYWRPPFGEAPLRITETEAVEEVRRLVRQAVKKRLRSDVPIGAFLSGGLDSSIIVSTMCSFGGERVRSFSGGFDGDGAQSFDERSYAREAAAFFQTEHREIIVRPESFDQVERLTVLHDGPFADASALPTQAVAQLARQNGVTVALTGEGADEIFCGYSRFLFVEAQERVPAALRKLGGIMADSFRSHDDPTSPLGKVQRFLRKSRHPLDDRILNWTSSFGLEGPTLLRPELRARIDENDGVKVSRELSSLPGASPLARALNHNFLSYLPDDLLLKSDRCSMMHGLELRCPMLDRELVEFAARLPDTLRRRGGTTKRLLRLAFADQLPSFVTTRRKMGFGVPLGAWLRGPLREPMGDLLGPASRLYDYVREAPVRALMRSHLSGPVDHGLRLWLLLTFEVWLRSLENSQARNRPLAFVPAARPQSGQPRA